MALSDLDKSEGLALFTDGSAWYKNRTGGWAYIIVDVFDNEAHASGAVANTTNNRMEMQAWIEGLTTIYEAFGPSEIIVFSDSEYVGLGAIDRARNRKCNQDLWQSLDNIIDTHLYVEFSHVKGHQGHEFNERADKLASEARRTISK